MTKPSNRPGIEAATGRAWNDWVTMLDAAGGRDKEHKAIARLVHQELSGRIDSAGWWAQGVAVAYEQYIGRRAPGQRSDGSYEVSVTKTIAGERENVFALWNEAYGRVEAFDGRRVHNERTSITPVRSYWRCELNDSSKISVAVEQKDTGKSIITVTHTALSSAQAQDEWRTYWKDRLERL